MREMGRYQNIGDLKHYIPDSLPPRPPLDFTPEMASLYGEASFRLGQLNEMAERLPDLERFIKAYVIKEALLSSAIEGINTTLLEVFTQPLIDKAPNKPIQLVLNYGKALEVAISMIKDDKLPIVSRVITAAHKALMEVGEGDRSDPGQYRKQSVRVGEFVPPPAPEIPDLMGELEKFINIDSSLPPLIRAGLAHVQFETIHPFLDGNGRIGRLLIVLMLLDEGLLSAPILYPSYYFKKHHFEYYQRLDRTRTHGDFEGWILFYLTAIKESSMDAHRRAKDIEKLERELTTFIQVDPSFSKMRDTALRALKFLFSSPILSIKDLSLHLGKSYNTANHMITRFVQLGWVTEEGDQQRNKLYRFSPYLKLLEQEYFD